VPRRETRAEVGAVRSPGLIRANRLGLNSEWRYWTTSAPQPGLAAALTPNIEATVTTRVNATIAAIPTATSVPVNAIQQTAPVKPTTLPAMALAPTSVRTAAVPAQPTAAPAPAVERDHGISFGKPLTIGSDTLPMIGVLTTNSSEQVKSFTVKATYKAQDRIVATASGAVNDLRPHEVRTASLFSTDKIPSTYDSVRVDVDSMVREASSTPGAEAASALVFGPPAVKSMGSLGTIDVEVTNKDNAQHSFSVQALILNGGELVGIASGAVNDLLPGQTKTASLLNAGRMPNYDGIRVAVDTVLR
jgi:hypothetical protein